MIADKQNIDPNWHLLHSKLTQLKTQRERALSTTDFAALIARKTEFSAPFDVNFASEWLDRCLGHYLSKKTAQQVAGESALQREVLQLKQQFKNWREVIEQQQRQLQSSSLEKGLADQRCQDLQQQNEELLRKCVGMKETLVKMCEAKDELKRFKQDLGEVQLLLSGYGHQLEDGRRRALAHLDYYSCRAVSLAQHAQSFNKERQALILQVLGLRQEVGRLGRLGEERERVVGRELGEQSSKLSQQLKQAEGRAAGLQQMLMEERVSRQARDRAYFQALKRIVFLEQEMRACM